MPKQAEAAFYGTTASVALDLNAIRSEVLKDPKSKKLIDLI